MTPSRRAARRRRTGRSATAAARPSARSRRVDARAASRDGVTVYFDASNLTDEVGMRYQAHANRPIEAEGVGRRFMGGVRFNF